MTWNQTYDPLGWWPLSTLVSALPVVTLFFVLLVLRTRVWISASCGFVMAVALALAVFHMPVRMTAAAGVNGFVFGFFRIAWIVIASICLYNVAVETGQFRVMKESIAGVSSDRRLQVILMAFCFFALPGTSVFLGAFLAALLLGMTCVTEPRVSGEVSPAPAASENGRYLHGRPPQWREGR